MKKHSYLLSLSLIGTALIVMNSTASVQFRGYTLSELYTFQDAAEKDHNQIYQTLSWRAEKFGSDHLSFVGHLRYQGDSVDEFAESGALKAHNLYLRCSAKRVDLRLGRQFLADGVTVGTYDVLRFKYNFDRGVSAVVWGGIAAPADRKAELQKLDQAPAFGFTLRKQIQSYATVNISYMREEYLGQTFRHLGGVSVNATPVPELFCSALAQVNLEGPSAIHRLRGLLRYRPSPKVRLWGEFAAGTPQLPPDTPFQIIEIGTAILGRLGGGYQIFPAYWIDLRLQSLLSGEKPNSLLGLSVEGPWGVIGYRQHSGDVGEESGVWGSARIQVVKFAQVYAAADYSKYKFEDYEQDEQSALQAGVLLFPVKSLECDASIQNRTNREFNQDVRGLLRVKWSFGN
ncbi:MAG: hypothetical protein NTW14_07865 [bacterium]|nr:hypothetical protein [bacterium]